MLITASSWKRAFALAVASMVAVSAPAVAANTPTVYQKTVYDRCGATGCVAKFGKVGRNQRLTIENVSCGVGATARASILGAQLVVGKVNRENLVPVLVAPSNAEQSYALNHNTQVLAKSRQKIRIVIDTTADEPLAYYLCKITGRARRTG